MSSSTTDSSSAAKKAKMMEEAELDAVQQYLLECPHVPKESRAIQAALKGIDQERKRIERDAKLLKKFSSCSTEKQSNVTTTKTRNNGENEVNGTAAAITVNTQNDLDDDAALMEWQDVAEKAAADDSLDDSSLGRRLGQAAISSMSQAGTQVKSPCAAIALGLHAALLELGFVCTGVPPSAKQKGFAPPIRPLPKDRFLPVDWDKHALDEEARVTLRYRKENLGAVNLQVVKDAQDTVEIHLTPANSKEPHPTSLQFALEDHCNRDSFQAALAGSPGGVLPALHYKALPVLMTNFCNTFDLGPVNEEKMTTEVPIIAHAPPAPASDTRFRPAATPIEPTARDPLCVYNPHEEPNISQFQQRHPRGDFAGDLLPGGLVDPSSMGPGGVPPPGNLMGPNHPMFQSGPPQIGGGGLGMRPRFDPYGPPGGPTDPNFVDPNNPNNNTGRPRPPPGGPGDPNPDHQRPPSDLSNNMFS